MDAEASVLDCATYLPPGQLEDVAEFFRTYKNMEGRVTEIGGWRDVDAVQPLLETCVQAASA